MKKACQKKMPYDFTYFILICKLYKSGQPHTQKKKRQQSSGGGEPEILWSNPEEEIINEVCKCSKEFTEHALFELDVAQKCNSAGHYKF
jgi:protein BCP1